MTRIKVSKRVVVAVLCCLALAVGLAACGGDDDSSGSSSGGGSGGSSAPVMVTIDNFAFSAKPVKAGQAFSVENKDSTEHTFTADNGAFDVDVPSGKTVEVKALDAGSFPFHCKIHSSMTGTLEVS